MAEYSDYVNPATLAETDPDLFARRGSFQGIRALPGSEQTLSPEEFSALLSGQQGAYGEDSTLSYDPKFGIYSSISDSELQRLREMQSVPDRIDPRLLTDVERTRYNLHRSMGNPGRVVYDDDGNVYNAGLSAQRIGDKKYFMNEDGTVTSYDVADVNYGYTPTFSPSRAPEETSSGNTTNTSGGNTTNNDGAGASSGTAGGGENERPPTEDEITEFYFNFLGGPPKPDGLSYWANSGLSISQVENLIATSPEGLEYADTGRVSGPRQEYMDSLSGGDQNGDGEDGGGSGDQNGGGDGGDTNTTTNTTTNNGNPDGGQEMTSYADEIAQYYQELFARDPQPAGAQYFQGQIDAGNINPDNLRETILSSAQGQDRTYYDASQSGGPLFSATQELFGRNPVRGQFNQEQGRLVGGFDQYRPMYDEGGSDAEIRQMLLNQAYGRGEGGGRSRDYQNYLSSLGINRENNPFLQEGGSYANVGYGSDLSQYQNTGGGGNQNPGGPYGKTAPFPTSPNSGGGFPGFPGKGGTMPQQYVTGNQLYSGIPYGFTSPYGKGGNGGMSGNQSTVYQPSTIVAGGPNPNGPYRMPRGGQRGKGGGRRSPYGMAKQYMPNMGLMSGYSSGFGPYSGYQRPNHYPLPSPDSPRLPPIVEYPDFPPTQSPDPTDYSAQISQGYQDLFNRTPQPAGAEYFQNEIQSGRIAPEDINDALIASAQGLDRTYYNASQSGGPMFSATQDLFGRNPARGRFNEEQGRLVGGYDTYRPMYDEGKFTDPQIRQSLLNLAYSRGGPEGVGMGTSRDYQYYLDSLGIDRQGRPFSQPGGGYANVPYGSDLSAYAT